MVGFTTVQPVGQLESPLVIVDSVPRAAGQVNVPEAATPFTQSVVAFDGFHAAKLTSIDTSLLQALNIN